MNALTDQDKTELVAIIQGDGHISISSASYINIEVEANTSGQALRARLLTGTGRMSVRRKKGDLETGKPSGISYRWRATADQAYGVLVALRPFFTEKFPQVERVLAFHEHVRAYGKYRRITDEERAWRLAEHKAVMKLHEYNSEEEFAEYRKVYGDKPWIRVTRSDRHRSKEEEGARTHNRRVSRLGQTSERRGIGA